MNFESELFDSFDAGSMFDAGDSYEMYDEYGQPVGTGSKKVSAVSRTESLVGLSITNSTGATQTLELFNFLNSVTKVANTTQYSSGLKPITGSNFNAANANDKIYFDENGNLVYNSGGNLMTLSSTTGSPYRALFEMSGNANFVIRMIRINTSTEAQLNNSLFYFQKTALGKFSQNEISPRTFFSPNQYQNKIVDIKQAMPIDSERGIFYNVNNGEVLQLQLFLRKVERVTNLSNK